MQRIKIKPLSVNDAWRGRRFKTKDYEKYCSDLLLLLPRNIFIPKGPLEIIYKFGLSSKLADYDNPIKPFQDVIFKKYGINDNTIYRGIIEKEIVEKGQEYAEFEIREWKKRDFL